MRRFAISIIVTTTIFMSMFIVGLVADPSLVLAHWEVYLLFIFLPYAVAALLLFASSKSRHRDDKAASKDEGERR